MERDAIFSPCHTFRYRLSRTWSAGPRLAVCLLNPSRAGAEIDDPTVRRLIGFGRRLDYGGFDLVNLFAFVTTYPRDLRAAGYPVGPDNDVHIELVCRGRPEVLCGWGNDAKGLARPEAVLRMLHGWGCTPKAVKINAGRTPAHPSRLAYTRELLEL